MLENCTFLGCHLEYCVHHNRAITAAAAAALFSAERDVSNHFSRLRDNLHFLGGS